MSGRVKGDLERFLIQGKEEDDGLVVTHDRADGETIVSGAGEDALVGHIGDAEVPPPPAPVQPYPQIVTVPDRRGVEVSMVPHDAPVPQIRTVPAFSTKPIGIPDIPIGSLPPVVTLDEYGDLMEEYDSKHLRKCYDPYANDSKYCYPYPNDSKYCYPYPNDSEQLRKYYPYASSSGTFATDASLIRPQGGGTGKSYGVKFGERFDFKKWFK